MGTDNADDVKKEEDEEVRTLDKVKQYYFQVNSEDWKFQTLWDMRDTITVIQALIFCNTNQATKLLTEKLTGKGYKASCIHGEMETSDGELVMKNFKMGTSRMLVATADLAREFDLHSWETLVLVINYDLPTTENYIYMVGRTEQFTAKLTAITFTDDIRKVQELEKFYKTEMEDMPVNITELIM